MKNGMLAVEKGISLRQAAEMYQIPKSTLFEHVTGKVKFGARSGPDPYLSVEEEEELVNFLVQVAEIGYPHTKKQVFSIVQQILISKGINSSVSNGWWERFCKRNPNVSLRSAVPLSLARASATDPEMLSRYYDTLEDCLRSNDIFDTPQAIFNCDETGLALNPTSLRVVQECGAKNPNFISGGDKSQLTVLVCSSAAGYALPPYIIFDRLTWNPKLADAEVPGSLYGMSKNGWINGELFHAWFVNHFLSYAPRIRPLILLMDGHSSHYCPDTIRYAAEEGILLFVLPPNTTHLTQPLDKGCFSPLKVRWRQICHEFRCKNPGRVITRFDFNQLFSEVWYESMSVKNITSSFKTTGVCPFNRHALKVPGMESKVFSLFQPERLVEKTGLKYIPLYSPSRRQSKVLEDNSNTPLLHRSGIPNVMMENESDIMMETGRPPPPNTIGARFHREASVPLRTSTNLTNFLNPPIPPSKIPTKKVKSCGKCLTNAEGLRQIEEKQKLKEEKIQHKEELKARKAKAKLEKQLKAQRQKQRQGEFLYSYERKVTTLVFCC